MKKYFLYIYLSIFLLFIIKPVYSDDAKKQEDKNHTKDEKKDQKKDPGKDGAKDPSNKNVKDPKQKQIIYKKNIYLPKIYSNFEEKSYKKNRFNVICLVGTWNPKSIFIYKWIDGLIEEFKSRNLGVFAVFSHETNQSLKDWELEYKPTYKFGVASKEFISELNNPRVPSVWILQNNGQILHYKELPKEEELLKIKENLKLWTDF